MASSVNLRRSRWEGCQTLRVYYSDVLREKEQGTSWGGELVADGDWLCGQLCGSVFESSAKL